MSGFQFFRFPAVAQDRADRTPDAITAATPETPQVGPKVAPSPAQTAALSGRSLHGAHSGPGVAPGSHVATVFVLLLEFQIDVTTRRNH